MSAPLEPVEITAGRLHLRPWAPDDAGALLEICQDRLIQRWTRVPTPYGRADAEGFLAAAEQHWADGSAATWAVLDATTAGLLASVALHGFSPGRGSAQVGYWAAPQARGRGVVIEALGAACRWGFGAIGLARLVCLASMDNEASQRTARGTGFAYEGVARGALDLGRGREDAWQAGLLATD